MVRRYAHLLAAHLADYAERLAISRVVQDTDLAQGPQGNEAQKS